MKDTNLIVTLTFGNKWGRCVCYHRGIQTRYQRWFSWIKRFQTRYALQWNWLFVLLQWKGFKNQGFSIFSLRKNDSFTKMHSQSCSIRVLNARSSTWWERRLSLDEIRTHSFGANRLTNVNLWISNEPQLIFQVKIKISWWRLWLRKTVLLLWGVHDHMHILRRSDYDNYSMDTIHCVLKYNVETIHMKVIKRK